ncbi:hypothetical protein Tco_1046177 [Tanacetum coccineum]
MFVPPNKQYDLVDANKKINIINPSCPPSSKILGNILNQHPLRFSLVASASVPWIYIQQVWHTLKLDDSKDKFKFFIDTKEFKFFIDTKEFKFTVDDFRRVFHLPQATKNKHAEFVKPFAFTEMLPFFLNELGYTTRIHLLG